MNTGLPVIDVFGILHPRRKHRTFAEVIEIIEGKVPHVPGESPWGFPVFRPTTGPGTGAASAGGRGIPRGSSHPDFTGVVVGPPKPEE